MLNKVVEDQGCIDSLVQLGQLDMMSRVAGS